MKFMEQTDYFFDCHCHTMTLAQPNLTAFMENIFSNAGPELIRGLTSDTNFNSHQGPRRGINNILNLAALVQNDLDGIFRIMEDDLLGLYGGEALANESGLQIGSRRYKSLVITPLLMDFRALPDAPSSTYYPQPLKDIHTAVNEYAFAIRRYYKNRPDGLLQIFPFLGINTAAYTLKEVETLLSDSFSLYTGDMAALKSRKLYTFLAGKIAPRRMFGGIKLYPPMGFDPWPDKADEREKVRFLYDYAQKRDIPITAHCNNGGYITIDYKLAESYTSPDKWAQVLKHYPGLRLNLAHMGYHEETLSEGFTRIIGSKREKNWTEKILDLIEEYPHVYTDFSFNGVHPSFYKYLSTLINEQGTRKRMIEDRILFGTDFMINLSSIPSYRDYYKIFEDSPLHEGQMHRFGSVNPRNFLNM